MRSMVGGGEAQPRVLGLSDTRPAKIPQPNQSATPIFTAGFSAPSSARIISSPRRIRAESRRTGRGEGSGGVGVALHQATSPEFPWAS